MAVSAIAMLSRAQVFALFLSVLRGFYPQSKTAG
jgi:hypothetical protein